MDITPSTSPIKLCYYITGHGYGHASRSIKMVEALIAQEDFDVHVVTTKQIISFMRFSLPPLVLEKITTHERILDAGAVQQDALTINPLQSLENYTKDIHGEHSTVVSTEVDFLVSNSFKVVCVDCTPIACRAANEAKCKVCIVANFTWDFIYYEMLKDVRQSLVQADIARYEDMISQCGRDYNCVDAYIRLPGSAPLPLHFDETKVRSAPLVSRLPTRSRRDVRSSLNIPPLVKVMLLCFGGGHNHTFHLEDSYLPAGWVCVVLAGPDREATKPPDAGLPPNRFLSVSTEYYLPDLINAADCVLGKLGYGFVSECLTCQTPLVYIRRSHWAEERYLQAHLEANKMGVFMELCDFDNGVWEKYLVSALGLHSKGEIISGAPADTDHDANNEGEGAAAEAICAMIRNVAQS